MKKTNSYLFTRIFVACFIVIGLILAMFPGIYAKTEALLIGESNVFFEAFVPTYTSIFGGNVQVKLELQQNSLEFANNLEVIEVLEKEINLNIQTNILVSIFFILSLIMVVIFLIYAKSRIISVITAIILIITTITFATSNLTFNMSSDSVVNFLPTYELSLGMMFLSLSYTVASAAVMFHLFRILIKPNSLKLEIDQSSLD